MSKGAGHRSSRVDISPRTHLARALKRKHTIAAIPIATSAPVSVLKTMAKSEQHATSAIETLSHCNTLLVRENAMLGRDNAQLRVQLAQLARKETKARHFAYHDELTGLPNRRLLLDRLTQAIALGARQRKQVAVLFFDLNGFKAINDGLGHVVGDKLLRKVAKRLSECLRTADTACRYGGDEFVIMLPEVDGEETAAAVEKKIRARIAAPYMIDGNEISMTASIGAAVYPRDGQDHGALIKRADSAMYHVKTNGDAHAGKSNGAGAHAVKSEDE
jgi:diguanylate cyclase (GGDEF)-like protein